ncbi:caffeoyl-CoA O-methyltransferase [Couchioplanes caeruleus]|uniref:Caffeoyl-CoA O-methyltransferase n=4 Tax=Couchioplanes caeruleus TaxID=56438 RepID=A0A3N1GVY8_9ACTN|nr:caffeoyl-CoA O-methyltransferase [Couchioplanes caeruleus]
MLVGMSDIIDPAISDYLLAHCTPADDALRELAAETRAAFPDDVVMQISQDEGQLLTLLVRLTGARVAVEVGVFTGYSAICIARGLAEGGSLLACDVSEEWTGVARRYWKQAGVADRIDLRIAPAIETLRALPRDPVVDFAFIDADKTGYLAYYEELVPRLRSGGLIVLDNVLQGGRVVADGPQSESVVAIREVNDRVVADDRVESVMLPVRDGVTLIRRR